MHSGKREEEEENIQSKSIEYLQCSCSVQILDLFRNSDE